MKHCILSGILVCALSAIGGCAGSSKPPAESTAQAAPNTASATAATLTGNWAWFNDITVTFAADGTARSSDGQCATWRIVDPAARTIEIRWDAGWIDTLTLSPDGRSLAGKNQHGTHVTGQRVK